MRQAKIIAVDFDGTLVDEKDGYVYPVTGAAESMQRLRSQGFKLVIYTCRTGIAHDNGRLSEEIDFIARSLDQFKIPFDEIYTGRKIVADAYSDDRGISFTGDWERTIEQVVTRLRVS